ncbi:unnamed protein product [Caenorhabditis auriculariae]|uniref:Translation initiation factor eIF2B subunit beta n=1 Tax=Caenorhabditis auriculariae TaxID=2777116 RepID=A0A8S1GPF7_9PELO|nr:unnamed protein product [Caenorhabditis auriculariae]
MESNEIESLRRSLVASFRKRDSRESSQKVALQVINYLRKVVLQEKFESLHQLIQSLHRNGRVLSAVEPNELIIINIVLMVSKLARDEAQATKGPGSLTPYDSLYTLWREIGSNEKSFNIKKIKKDLIQSIKEIITEVETSRDSIASQASELINSQDVVLVYSLKNSPTLDGFLASARRTRKYRVYNVVKSTEIDDSPDFATPIQHCDVGNKMCETTKVVLSGAAVFPDGSCLVPAGGLTIALTAQRHSVPVFVLAAFYKITPFFIPDPSALNTSCRADIPFDLANKLSGKVELIQPAFDILPSQLISLFVSNSSSLIPAHVNRLKEDYYHPQDISEF